MIDFVPADPEMLGSPASWLVTQITFSPVTIGMNVFWSSRREMHE